jgi:tetratricopeptide (TPR) repeat protein
MLRCSTVAPRWPLTRCTRRHSELRQSLRDCAAKHKPKRDTRAFLPGFVERRRVRRRRTRHPAMIAVGDYAQAERAYRNALSLEPERSIAKFNLGIAMRNQGRAAEAIPLARSLIAEDPSDLTNMQALIDSGKEWVRGGPINRLMRHCFLLAFLRLPLVLAVLLMPIAWVERRARRDRCQKGPGRRSNVPSRRRESNESAKNDGSQRRVRSASLPR